MRVRSAVAALVNSIFINLVGNMAAGARRINVGITFTNYPQFTLNQYREVGQKRAHSAKTKKCSG